MTAAVVRATKAVRRLILIGSIAHSPLSWNGYPYYGPQLTRVQRARQSRRRSLAELVGTGRQDARHGTEQPATTGGQAPPEGPWWATPHHPRELHGRARR